MRAKPTILPSNWRVERLGEVCSVFRGGSPRPISAYLTNSPSGENWIKIGDVNPGEKYIRSTSEKITADGASRSRRVFAGSFLLSNSMSFGRPYILKIDGCIHDGWLVIQDYEKTFSTEYLYYLLSSEFILSQYRGLAAGSSVLNLNKDIVSSITVLAPPIVEQRAIAEALSDMDDLISTLEKLITKKRNIKQAAMQQLLTGKTRLPGFNQKWEKKSLGDIVQIKKGQLITRSTLSQGDVPVIAGGKSPAYFHSNANRFGKTITISASGANAGYVALHHQPIFASDCSTISESENYCISFVFFQLLCFQERIYKAQTGGAQPHIHARDLNPLVFEWPPLPEQRAIAEFLTDMDEELSLLEKRLKKTRNIKQAMMQELLTGKTRLVQKGRSCAHVNHPIN